MHDHIWRSAMTIEYLAEEELGTARKEGEELLIVLTDDNQDQSVYKMGYRRDADGYTWPLLTAYGSYTAATNYETFLLTLGSAKRETFEHGRPRGLVGPSVVRIYAEHLRTIENALSKAATPHYVDFSKSSRNFSRPN